MIFNECNGECTEHSALWWMKSPEELSPQLKAFLEENKPWHAQLLIKALVSGPAYALPLSLAASRAYHKWLDTKIQKTVTGEDLIAELASRIEGLSKETSPTEEDTPEVNEETKLSSTELPPEIFEKLPKNLQEMVKNGDAKFFFL